MSFTTALARKHRRENRYEIRIFINEETCGYTIFDHVFNRVVERGTGYDGNYASMRAAQEAVGWLTGESHHISSASGTNCQFSTDNHRG